MKNSYVLKFTKIKFQIALSFAIMLLTLANANAQCTNASSFGSATINTGGSLVTVSTCSFGGEFSPISGAVAGQSLQFTVSDPTYFITIHSGTSNGPVLAFGTTPLVFANTFTGTLYAHWNTNSLCGSSSSCRTTTVQCTSCTAPPPVDPCTSITDISSCGVSINLSLSGSGSYSPGSCGFSTPGQEKIYTFTPTTTGIYQIQTTAASGGFIDYFYKPVSAGCSATGWTCIQDISSATTFGSLALTAGTQYYILTDAEGTSARSQTFNVVCGTPPPPDPCTNITSISGCGVNIVTSSIGNGTYNPPNSSCGFSTPGQEKIYSFTPTVTAFYQIQVTAASGGFVDFFYKDASGGCSANGWTCIGDINATGTYGSLALIGGTPYYFLLDPETTVATSVTWNLICPIFINNDLCGGATPVSCGSSTSGTTVGATNFGETSLSGCGGLSISNPGVWYVLQGNGQLVTATTCGGPAGDMEIHVFSGTCGNLTCVGANDDNSIACPANGLAATFSFLSVTGVDYYILVNTFGSAPLPFTLSLSCVPFDPCTNISNITCGVPQIASFATGIGSFDPVSTSCGFSTPGLENIYSFTPTISGFHQISQTGSSSISYFFKEAINGCSGTGWTCIDHLIGGTSTNTAAFNLTAGTQYYVMLDNENVAGSNVTFSIVCPAGPAPSNDLCSGAISVACGSTITGTTVNATTVNENALSPCGVSITQPGVWYVFTGNGQQVTASTCSGLSGDTKISVFTGFCGSLTCVGGNDDASPVCGTNSLASTYTFVTSIGVNYYILIHTFSGTLPFTLNISCSNLCNTPPNDNCSGAQTLTIESGASCSSPTTGDNSCNTAALFNPTCDAGSVINDNWYTFTTGNCTGNLTISLNAITAVDLRAAIYTGTCAGLTEVSCNNSISGPITLTSITSNTTYYLQVYTTNSTPGTFSVCINQTIPTEICGNSIDDNCNGLIDENDFTFSNIKQDVRCKGTNSGIINLFESGTGTFTFLWNNGSTLEDQSNLYAGVYTVTVSNGPGCAHSASFTITQPAEIIVLNGAKTNVRCGGKTTGRITISPVGGVSPFTYLWNSGSTSATVSNLPAGTFTCSVTDAVGCIKSKSVAVTQNLPMVVVVTPVGNSATASVSDGVPPYSYFWNTASAQSSTTATGLTPGGSYKVKVTDSKGCTKVVSFNMPSLRFSNETNSNSASIYPNPTTGIFVLNIADCNNCNATITVYDLLGKEVYFKQVKMDGNIELDLSFLTKSIYNMHIKYDNRIETIKLVLQ